MTPLFDIVNIHLKHDPEKHAALFRIMRKQKSIKRDGGSPRSHHPLLAYDAMPDDGLRSGQRAIHAPAWNGAVGRLNFFFGRLRCGRLIVLYIRALPPKLLDFGEKRSGLDDTDRRR